LHLIRASRNSQQVSTDGCYRDQNCAGREINKRLSIIIDLLHFGLEPVNVKLLHRQSGALIMTDEKKREKGIAFFKKLTEGQERQAKSVRAAIPEKFTRYTMEHLFGDVWQGEEIPLELRSLLTCTILVALNREAEQRIHFPGAKNLGVSREQLEAMIIHAAHYAGWPVAASAFRVLAEVWPVEEA